MWVRTPVVSGQTLLIRLVTGVVTHLRTEVNHHVVEYTVYWSKIIEESSTPKSLIKGIC